jgi:selenocysteine lyase/cysteine desulfurase
LEAEYGILTRPGLHCAPLAHEALGTIHSGSTRFSFGLYNSPEDVDTALTAVEKFSKQGTK